MGEWEYMRLTYSWVRVGLFRAWRLRVWNSYYGGYSTADDETKTIMDYLNLMGAEGWELVSETGNTCTLKRLKR